MTFLQTLLVIFLALSIVPLPLLGFQTEYKITITIPVACSDIRSSGIAYSIHVTNTSEGNGGYFKILPASCKIKYYGSSFTYIHSALNSMDSAECLNGADHCWDVSYPSTPGTHTLWCYDSENVRLPRFDNFITVVATAPLPDSLLQGSVLQTCRPPNGQGGDICVISPFELCSPTFADDSGPIGFTTNCSWFYLTKNGIPY